MSGLFMRALEAFTPADITASGLELLECQLYQAIDEARRKRHQLDRMAWSMEYVAIERERDKALDRAQRHLRAIQRGNAPLDELLAQMLNAEGIQP